MSNASSRAATSAPSGSRAAFTVDASAAAGSKRAVAIARDHRRRPREQVAEVVPELSLVALVEARDRDVAVLAERDRPRAPEPHRVGAVDVDQVERVDDVAERLRDLAVVEQQVPVHEELPCGTSYPAASSIAGQ